jgi:hypothetical protein
MVQPAMNIFRRIAISLWNGTRSATKRRKTTPPAREPVLDAYAFESDLSLETMRDVLNRQSGRSWRLGDSGWVGDYLSTPIAPHGSLRLYEENGHFIVEMRRMAITDEMRAMIEQDILPLLGARNVRRDAGFD